MAVGIDGGETVCLSPPLQCDPKHDLDGSRALSITNAKLKSTKNLRYGQTRSHHEGAKDTKFGHFEFRNSNLDFFHRDLRGNDYLFFFGCGSTAPGTIMVKIMGKFAKLSPLTFIAVYTTP
jgi:hypothetical protein